MRRVCNRAPRVPGVGEPSHRRWPLSRVQRGNPWILAVWRTHSCRRWRRIYSGPNAGDMMQAVHVSPYGGAWYPGCRTDLELLLDDLFETSTQRTGAWLF